MGDRTVHAYGRTDAGTSFEVVRYNKAGKWYCELRGDNRRPISLTVAVDLGVHIARTGTGQVFWNVPGGKQFDARVRADLKRLGY